MIVSIKQENIQVCIFLSATIGCGQGVKSHTLKRLNMVLQVFLPKQQAVQSVGDCDTIVA